MGHEQRAGFGSEGDQIVPDFLTVPGQGALAEGGQALEDLRDAHFQGTGGLRAGTAQAGQELLQGFTGRVSAAGGGPDGPLGMGADPNCRAGRRGHAGCRGRVGRRGRAGCDGPGAGGSRKAEGQY
ncbi:MAG: hypothetical protein CMJ87_11445 [Planctomycetes bacterium]|nr:hypothetical protein [Planctomycetota bacterium]